MRFFLFILVLLPGVSRSLQFEDEGNPARNVIVWFKSGTQSVLDIISNTDFSSRTHRITSLVESLKDHASQSQSEIIGLLQSRGHQYSSFKTLWITNQMYISNASSELLQIIQRASQVKLITDEIVYDLDEPLVSGPIITGRPSHAEEWGISKIEAREALHFLSNSSQTPMSNVRVGTIGTGVRHTHEALRDNFLGEYGWYDPYEYSPEPIDTHGHGTHTMGILAGSNGIGVFPYAQWLTCKGCNGNECTTSALIQCGEFLTCPFKSEGTSEDTDCSKAPQVVSNSWNWVGVVGSPYYDGVIAAWHVAGIIPFFSAGDSGPNCETVSSPADRDVIAVGSTTSEDLFSQFSSVGPGADDRLKPDFSAPGSDIVSAYHTADNAYRSLSGTGMACPHAAGTAALLFAFQPDLSFQKILIMIRSSAEREKLKSSGMNCYGLRDNVFPNFFFGYGRVNALNCARYLHQHQQK